MPFYLYEIRDQGYKQLREVKLAGQTGPFAVVARRLTTSGGWHLPESSLVGHLLGLQRHSAEPLDHAVVIDLKPRDRKVSLYRLRDVWGFSYEDWTPVALRLETLYVDHEQGDPDSFKQAFSSPLAAGDLVHEFLYLNGGIHGGPWTWGLVGRVNGALLWPDALDYFVQAITPTRLYRRTFPEPPGGQ